MVNRYCVIFLLLTGQMLFFSVFTAAEPSQDDKKDQEMFLNMLKNWFEEI